MPDRDEERVYTQSEIDTLVDVEELRHLLGRMRGEPMSRSYANRIAERRGFPEPLINHPHLRLFLRADVEEWLDRNRPGWRETG
ncbi:hypothetical protein [Glutamicibacter sp. V16R2B1]|uniref:hypothetical protein n=1 Tax=Glutamicibacter sp. V16R2B1 TaxID=2036207 RepID=UPI0010FE243A|nr:hypothetical protein [Glutamicibacter sp. V16R2B1]MCK9901356.1 hypothetical protein [Frankia sp. Cpl3]TLK48000.1 hypothetical protein FDN03_15405 [Glutamicibacter sp. V16R2B1]